MYDQIMNDGRKLPSLGQFKLEVVDWSASVASVVFNSENLTRVLAWTFRRCLSTKCCRLAINLLRQQRLKVRMLNMVGNLL